VAASQPALHSQGAAPALLRVSILGAGAEGCWLAARAAQAGFRVTLEDLMTGKRRQAATLIQDVIGNEFAPSTTPLHPITYAASVEEAARHADLVIDFVPDELESKLEIFSLLDRMAPPHTIFATPTRSLSIADLASCTYRPERCLGLRLPPTLNASSFEVTILHAPAATPDAIEALTTFWYALGAKVTLSLDEVPLP
jgi:3-hydroxybutyryl-CoA dehydrogenase